MCPPRFHLWTTFRKTNTQQLWMYGNKKKTEKTEAMKESRELVHDATLVVVQVA